MGKGTAEEAETYPVRRGDLRVDRCNYTGVIGAYFIVVGHDGIHWEVSPFGSWLNKPDTETVSMPSIGRTKLISRLNEPVEIKRKKREKLIQTMSRYEGLNYKFRYHTVSVDEVVEYAFLRLFEAETLRPGVLDA